MPLPFFLTSSDNFTGGMAYTRFKGVTLSGTIGSTNAGPIEVPGGLAVIQPALIVSSAGQRAQILSTAAANVALGSFVYISQTTGPVSTSSFASSESAPPMSGMGAAVLWDAGRSKFAVFSTVGNSWMYSAAFTSS